MGSSRQIRSRGSRWVPALAICPSAPRESAPTDLLATRVGCGDTRYVPQTYLGTPLSMTHSDPLGKRIHRVHFRGVYGRRRIEKEESPVVRGVRSRQSVVIRVVHVTTNAGFERVGKSGVSHFYAEGDSQDMATIEPDDAFSSSPCRPHEASSTVGKAQNRP